MSQKAVSVNHVSESGITMDAESFFFHAKWPNGYCCPRCSHKIAYRLRSRSVPLYQCAHCRHQTSLTSGTMMERTRIPLEKWLLALHYMAQPGGVTAVQLQHVIQISYKSAWYMLKRVRFAISMIDMEQRLHGTIAAGLDFYGGGGSRSYFRKRKEHTVVALQGCLVHHGSCTAHDIGPQSVAHEAFGSSTRPESCCDNRRCTPNTIIKLKIVNPALMTNRTMPIVLQPLFFEQHLHVDALVHHPAPLGASPTRGSDTADSSLSMLQVIYLAKQWIDTTFHGIGAKYLQLYWDEYCFRENCSRQGRPILYALAAACLRGSMTA